MWRGGRWKWRFKGGSGRKANYNWRVAEGPGRIDAATGEWTEENRLDWDWVELECKETKRSSGESHAVGRRSAETWEFAKTRRNCLGIFLGARWKNQILADWRCNVDWIDARGTRSGERQSKWNCRPHFKLWSQFGVNGLSAPFSPSWASLLWS